MAGTGTGRGRSRQRRREVYVYTEGEVSEPEYVDQLKRRQHAFTVKVSNEHGGPDRIVPLAIKFKQDSDRDAEREGLPPSERPVVWCVFDRDQHPDVDALIARAEVTGVRVSFSHPCFELWVLLHYAGCAAPMAGRCASAEARLRRHHPARGKRVRLDDLTGRYDDACQRAQRIAAAHARDGNSIPSSRDPSTNVWELVEFLGAAY